MSTVDETQTRIGWRSPRALAALDQALAVAQQVAGPYRDTGSLAAQPAAVHETVGAVVRRFEAQLRPGDVAAPPSGEIPEGLDDVDVHAYANQQLSAGEHMDLWRFSTGSLPRSAHADAGRLMPVVTAATEVSHLGAAEAQPAADSADVQRDAATDEARLAASIPAEGDVAQVPVYRLLAELFAAGATGVVEVSRDGITRNLAVEAGHVVTVSSTARQDRLVELLYKEGRISRSQYESVALTVATSGRRAGVILVEKGVISTRELFPLVRYHYETLLFDTLAWQQGRWRFANGVTVGERIRLDKPLPVLLIEGFREPALAQVAARMVPLDACPVRRGTLLPEVASSLEDTERRLLAALDGNTPVEALARRLDMEPEEARALVAALVVLGAVQCTPSGGDVPVAGAPGGERHDATGGAAGVRALLERKLAQVQEGSYFDLLEVAPGMDAERVQRAYDRLRGVLADAGEDGGKAPQWAEDLRVVLDVLDEARFVLQDPDLASRYAAALRRAEDADEE